MKCTHQRTRTIATRCFDGGVSKHNRAHGNICDEEECLECGARRSVNMNGLHTETGDWGPSAAERARVERDRRRAAAREAAKIAPLRIGRGDVYVTVSVDNSGHIVIEGQHTEEDSASALRWLARAQPEWLQRAKDVRKMFEGNP